MKKSFGQRKYYLILLAVLITACSSTGKTTKNNQPNRDLTLRQHLEKKSGVIIRGKSGYTEVYIRGSKSMSSFAGNKATVSSNPEIARRKSKLVKNKINTQPLFVINHTVVGRGFRSASSVLSNAEIKSVRVLPPSQSSQWGGRGAYGVIVVTTKTAKKMD